MGTVNEVENQEYKVKFPWMPLKHCEKQFYIHIKVVDLPDRPLSRQEGTKTSLAELMSGRLLTASRLLAFSYFQIPFRFFH